MIIDGKARAKSLRQSIAKRVGELTKGGARAPGLATVLVGDDPASQIYIRYKIKAAAECHIKSMHHGLDKNTSQGELLELIETLNRDESVDAILVQLPLPKHIDDAAVINAIAIEKDVDGFHPTNVARLLLGQPGFVPCTPQGCMRLLKETGIELEGANAVVIGRSNIVGKPMAHLLLAENATVTVAHSKTKDLESVCKNADVLIVAAGKKHLVKASFVKPGAVVIDVGINRDQDNNLCGDVDFDNAKEHAAFITPVPGGVGPMTIAELMQNTVRAYARRQNMVKTMNDSLKRTPLFDEHKNAGAKMVPFAGYEMPVRYTSDKQEHMCVREKVGLFDVSHMGEVFIEGKGAKDAVQMLFSNDANKLDDGSSMYTGMLNPSGGFVDDCIVYRFDEAKYLVCVNASNREKDVTHIRKVCESFDVTVKDESDDWVQIAVQGPKAVDLVEKLSPGVSKIAGFTFKECDIHVEDQKSFKGLVARTGYTGEDGFELYVKNDHGPDLWRALLRKGKSEGVAECGLGARDTLRLEAALRLYGNDIDENHTPYEAGLSWTVKLDAGDFVGKDALIAQKEKGIPKRMRGFIMHGRGIPRSGYEVQNLNGEKIGVITSGTQAPFLAKPIAMGYVQTAEAAFGASVNIIIRDKPVEAELVKLPFYKRKSS